MNRRITIGALLFLSVLLLFLAFVAAFIFFQQKRERQYKVDSLNIHLKAFNDQMHASFPDAHGLSEQQIAHYVSRHANRHQRVTLIRADGTVFFDTAIKDYRRLANHRNRPEIAEALRTGSGYIKERNSTSTNTDYFYCASYYPREGYIIRSAMPYDSTLTKTLQADHSYLLYALIIFLILILILYQFTRRLSNDIVKLNRFAQRAAGNEPIEAEDLIQFSDDELGDTAERIVKLYMRLEKTRRIQVELKGQLTQNVAHELKTPVASIQGYLETILNARNLDDAKREQFLERCYDQCRRLTSLLNDISTLNRLDDGSDLISFEDVDLRELIDAICKESRFRLEERGMTMSLRLPDHLPMYGSRSLLYSIFGNLTDNAIAYAGTGTTITIAGESKDDVWHFLFSDNGVGVSDEHLGRLFERFYRVDKGRSRKLGGTGLGLAIVKNAVLVHGGTISVRNNPAGGLCFEFTLPGKRPLPGREGSSEG